MEPPEPRLDDVPEALAARCRALITGELYPHDLYPRPWFPDLDPILYGLFRERWAASRELRAGLAEADEARADEMIAAELALPSLLARHPHALVMIYRPMIARFIRRLHRRPDESEDILQEVFARLLSGKLARIQKRFDTDFGQAPHFTSYFMVCVRNMYIDVVREGGNLLMKRDDVPMQVLETDVAHSTHACPTAFLDEEFAKLRAILQLHPSSRDRIVLCLKLKCRFTVTSRDVRRCFPAARPEDISLLCADFRSRRDRDLYRAVVPVFNRHEAKPVLADTLRKWVENKTGLLIAHLNRLHGQAVYDGENITDLLGLFFKEEDERDQA